MVKSNSESTRLEYYNFPILTEETLTSTPVYHYQHLLRQDCPLPPGTQVVVYCRDSGGDDQDRSVGQQIEAAKEYCDRHHLIIDHIYRDEAKLSSNTVKRSALRDLLLDLRQRFRPINDKYKRQKIAQEKPYGVVFWKSNRLGRDSIEATHIKADLRLRGITIVDLVTSATTGNAGMDALIEAFQQYQDELLLDEISSNVKRGMAELVSKRDNDPEFLQYNPGWPSAGGYLGLRPGEVPVGFQGEYVTVGTYKRRNGKRSGELRRAQRLVPDPATWEKCREAWEMRHNGAPIGQIHEKLHLFNNVNGYSAFFANRLYTGDLVYGGVLYENFVPAMIPKAWYEAELERKAARKAQRQGRPVGRAFHPGNVGSGYLLSGLVYCGAVDGEEHPMHFESIGAKKGIRGAYRFAICNVAKASKKQNCQAKRVNLRLLEPAVIDHLTAEVLTLENLRPLADSLARSLAAQHGDAETRLQEVEAKLRDTRKALDNILDAIERMGYASHLQERYDARRRDEAQLEAELGRLKAMQATTRQVERLTDDMLLGWVKTIRADLEGEDRAAAQKIMRTIIQKIVIRDHEVKLTYSFPLPTSSQSSSFYSMGAKGLEPLTSRM